VKPGDAVRSDQQATGSRAVEQPMMSVQACPVANGCDPCCTSEESLEAGGSARACFLVPCRVSEDSVKADCGASGCVAEESGLRKAAVDDICVLCIMLYTL